ncbi:HAD-IIA family hydrolase [Paenibacillus sp. Soil724D2]|uniref:HAD-IIA family hydrolase n=1 Tax=Paenibacillus sp. (strain Soil724D2) TaxID=1736392 RepID=UPI0007150364|nr:HAD-IIA family hydrolase [Paenibacillus sp. Soil724D2]KRE40581.1 HAD family hydrolase [Paenibacillus sp. Soil724D2]
MKDFAGYIFDLDGTIYLGGRLIDGAAEVIESLQSRHKKILFLTNKTIESRDKYVTKLNGLGIKVGIDQILSPTLVTIRFLKEKYEDCKIYVIGEPLIKEEFKQAGFTFAESPEETDVIITSWDREFHYSHLDFAYQAIKKGAMVLATNPDRTCPTEGGDVPDCGGMIGAIEGATGKKIELITGKPSIYMAKAALESLKLNADQCLMTGDRLETDILMGKLAGLHTALVLTGITQKEDIFKSDYQPDYILNSVYDLLLEEVIEETASTLELD